MGHAREIFELEDGQRKRAVIRVIGVGGGGCNTVNQMSQAGIEGVDFVCANTDRDHLERCVPTNQIQLGVEITRGLGAGSNPEVGRQAAEEDRDRIREMIQGTDLLFVTAGMGGGTGTGAAPVIAEIAKELGILTVAVVTKPFTHEGKKRMAVAMKGVDDLRQYTDSLIMIPNEKLGLVLGTKITVLNCFKAANDVLQNAVQGISDLITRPGLVNVDFADVRTVMSNRGMSMMGIGEASGESRAEKAVEMALSSPLLDDIELHGARGLLVNVTCDESLTMEELEYINSRVSEIASDEADAKCGMSMNPNLDGVLRVTVVATGLPGNKHSQQQSPQMAQQNPRVAQFVRPEMQMPVMPNLGSPSLDIPAVHRQQRKVAVGGNGGAFPLLDEDIINIPAFLRNQAD
ncbi:cell division protein FtsZ [Sinimarinibacterium sp. CAU 1509]|uniref:cell division protein FtsZ n=1 Tax=Sinimarinibacterium sp. CAU 1509 TaxID=2562283 RepID=UPI0010AB90DC|nr:cell division protein FtsZ [Sinimarinibacterium sp. CAU 1509]TJY65166.1 cell division protein FtsZ [Sinimarinibacterium sp. CAU 1509]